jgi:hypothetical protein
VSQVTRPGKGSHVGALTSQLANKRLARPCGGKAPTTLILWGCCVLRNLSQELTQPRTISLLHLLSANLKSKLIRPLPLKDIGLLRTIPERLPI